MSIKDKDSVDPKHGVNPVGVVTPSYDDEEKFEKELGYSTEGPTTASDDDLALKQATELAVGDIPYLPGFES